MLPFTRHHRTPEAGCPSYLRSIRVVSFQVEVSVLKILLTCLLGAGLALAQFDSATVLGTVRDKTGGVIAAASITLANLDTGIETRKSTDESGSFEFFTVRPGRYRVSAEAPGFSKAVAAEVAVSVGARQRVDLEMAVGQVTETVEVTGAAKLIETDSSQRGQVVNQRAIVELPLNGRAYSSLALLSTGTRASLLSTGGATPREGSFNVNGLRSTVNNFLLDGIDNNAYGTSNQGFSNQVMQPPPDAVAEFQVVTNNMSAEYGRSGGATVNVAYKSGGNNMHGSAWEFLRNRALNATGFFKPRAGVKPPLARNQFGFTLGGPMRPNRAFYFLDYEGFRQVRRGLDFANLPTMDDRRGVFSVPVRNPLTGALYPANTPIPPTDISPFARRVFTELPAPTAPGRANNFQLLRRFSDFTDKYNAKFDYQLNNRWNGFTRLGQRKANIFDEPNIPGPAGGDGNGYTYVLNQQLASAATYTPSPTDLLEIRMGISRTIAGKRPPALGGPTMESLFGIRGLPNDPRVAGGLTTQVIGGLSNLGRQATNPQWQFPTLWNPKVNFSRFLGQHSLKAGYEYQRVHTQIQDVNPLYGQDSYQGFFSRPAGVTANDNSYNIADFLFGARNRYALTNFLIANYRQTLNFFYLQDDFRVSRKLTLNLGTRFEYATPQWDANNVLSNFDPVGLKMEAARSGGVYERALIRPDRNNWAPRAGLAYSLDQRTVIRSGFGVNFIHFNRSGGGNILAINGPQLINAVVTQSPGPGFRPTQDGYPADLTSPARFNPLVANITYMPRDTRTSYVMSWFFSVQRQIAANTLLDVAYVGNRSNKLLLFADYNQARPNTNGSNIALQARRPIASFSDITYAFNGGWANYNSLQVRFERRYGAGFFLLNSFTYSKALDNSAGALENPNGAAASPQDFYNLGAEKAVSAYDQTLTNVTSVVARLPFGKGRRYLANAGRAANAIAGGWSLSFINNWWTGAPINLNPHFRFEPRVRISWMLVRINIDRGLKAAKTPAEDSTQWVTNKTSPFSSRSTAFSRSTSRDRALLPMVV
ncbi:MAG: TonB-dependent receptor [Acidobacteria bacterium]|nr:TonB-dependent receptor [Acidobacteriota bacterium]